MKKRFGDAVHSARLYVGRNINDPNTGTKIGEVTENKVRSIVEHTIRRGTGGLTVFTGQGRYLVERKGKMVPWGEEKTVVLDVASAASDSCPVFKKRVHSIAGKLAKIGKQDSVLAVIDCASATRDATYVGANGKRRQALFPLTPARRRKKRRR